jgi:Protein of unknown function (DUF2946)
MVFSTRQRQPLWIVIALQRLAVAKQMTSRQAIALFIAIVLAFNLLLPAMAGATVKRDQFASLFNIICTSAGLKVMSPEGGSSSSHSQQNGVHCPLCVLGGAAPLPSQTALSSVVFQASTVQPPASLEQSFKKDYWPSASPRGPPSNA